ncbi:hypothetical protein PMAYCL1PPCAC_03008, partial [Pristionchus mayeri]
PVQVSMSLPCVPVESFVRLQDVLAGLIRGGDFVKGESGVGHVEDRNSGSGDGSAGMGRNRTWRERDGGSRAGNDDHVDGRIGESEGVDQIGNRNGSLSIASLAALVQVCLQH